MSLSRIPLPSSSFSSSFHSRDAVLAETSRKGLEDRVRCASLLLQSWLLRERILETRTGNVVLSDKFLVFPVASSTQG